MARKKRSSQEDERRAKITDMLQVNEKSNMDAESIRESIGEL